MSKISKISIVHSVSRKFEAALEACSKTCDEYSADVEGIFSINDKSLKEKISKIEPELVLVIGGDGTMISAVSSDY